jgi:hypothetical protein
MSHYTCVIVGDDPEKQLEPYNENTEVAPYVVWDKKSIGRKLKSKVAEYQKIVDENDVDTYNIKHCKEQLEKYKKMSSADYWKEVTQYTEPEKIVDGKIYSRYNKNSKWDWYQLGGRWTGFFKAMAGVAGVVGHPGLGAKTPKPGY